MQYVHGHAHRGDTIAALATPPGVGGIAIIRVSGEKALEIASHLVQFSLALQPSHTVKLRPLYSPSGNVIDRALVLVMRAPRSFTGEETVEIHCHGGHLIARRVLESLSYYGARPAEPGEFSMRAFLHGKIDLAQAEAIQELIGAKSEEALKVAEAHLEGKLSQAILKFQKEGTRIAAIFEAWVDFPEEGLEFAPFEEVVESLEKMKGDIEQLLMTYRDGKIIHDGITLSLVGAPNVGKSSLMNALLGKERAIVSPIAGTTRDLVEDDATFNGVPFRLIDTAGIRETQEIIEGEGIRRSLQVIDRADLVLVVLDATRPYDEEMIDILKNIPAHKSIIVWNKIDILKEREDNRLHDHQVFKTAQESLKGQFPSMPSVYVSAATKEGFQELKAKIDQVVWSRGALPRDEVMITSVRHKRALEAALQSLIRVLQGLVSGESPEFVVFDMKHFLKNLGSVIGTDITEDILTAIFSQFCIGK